MIDLNGIFIDDAGTPGVKPPSKFLPESRKSWCGVVIPSKISNDVATAMTIFIEGVKSDYGAEELHYTDIYSGRGIWKNVKLEKRIEVFDLMSLVLKNFPLPIFYQTWSTEFQNDHEISFKNSKNAKMEFWNLHRVDHFGLILLVYQIRQGIKELRKLTPDFQEVFQVNVDEGISSAGTATNIPCIKEDIFEGKVQFESSKNNLGIQIADFCAFIVSRSQWIMMNKKGGVDFKRGDKHILEINAKLNHWCPDMHFVKGDEKFISREGIEFLMKRDRQQKGLSLTPE